MSNTPWSAPRVGCMNNILQWEPEKSRILASAKIENILHVRDDLATLAEWIRAKAESSALAQKADNAKVRELEKASADIRSSLAAFQQQFRLRWEDILQKIERLERSARSSEEAMAQCARAEESVRLIDTGLREAMATAEEHLTTQTATVARHVEDAQSAAAQSIAAKEECLSASRELRTTSEQFMTSWDEVRQRLERISSGIEQKAAQVEALAQTVREGATECEAKARDVRDRCDTLEAQQSDSTARITDLLHETEAQAAIAVENAQLTLASSQLASSLKTECEGLLQTLHLKGEELSSTWQNREREFTEWADTARAGASAAAEAVRSSQSALAECQAAACTHAELGAKFQAQGEDLSRQIKRLEEMHQAATTQVATTGSHLQSCQALKTQMAEIDAKLRALAAKAETQNRASEERLADFQRRTLTFGGRLKWLISGSGAP